MTLSQVLSQTVAAGYARGLITQWPKEVYLVVEI